MRKKIHPKNIYLNSKKNKEDLQALFKQKIIKPNKKLDQRSYSCQEIDYSHVKELIPGKSVDYPFTQYDNIFNFLYKSPMLYTRILIAIDKIHHQYGYLVPIKPSELAQNVGFPLQIIEKCLHTFYRKGILYLYKNNIIRLNKNIIKKYILEQMLYRHPSKTPQKPLGYKSIKPLSTSTKSTKIKDEEK